MTERTEQAAIVTLLRSVRAAVYVLGTVRRRGDHPGTMQSPGLPDLLVFLPARDPSALRRVVDADDAGRVQLWIEVKKPGGRLSPAQRAFRELCDRSGQAHLVGGLEVVLDWLRERRYVLSRPPVPRATHHI